MQRVIMLTVGVLLRHWDTLTPKERRGLSSEKIYELIVNKTTPFNAPAIFC